MRIKLINHACLIIDCGDIRILTDPWVDGNIFDNGWSLITTTKLPQPESYDYVWISHEHPDHFRPSIFDGKKIPLEKTILIHKRDHDQKLKNFFVNKGYKIKQIPNEGMRIGKVFINGGISKSFDSWISTSYNGKTFLNLNDCVAFSNISEIQQIKDKIGPIDCAALQFSFANWTGNKGDIKIREKAKLQTFNKLESIFSALKPKNVIPFASFSYFSHEENFYLNRNAIKITELINHFDEQNFSVLKVGDIHTLDETRSKLQNQSAINFWEKQYNKINDLPKTKTSVKSIGSLFDQFKVMQQYLSKHNDLNQLKERLYTNKKNIRSIIFLSDHKKFVEYNIFGNMSIVDSDSYDISMTSECLFNLMKNKWGYGTLMINGRFQANYETFSRFALQSRLYYMNNIGKFYPNDVKIDDIRNPSSLVKNLLENE